MTNSKKGQGDWTVRLPLVALALANSAAVPAWSQENGNPAPAPSSSRPIDFRLPPADDGRTPGVQGPANNGLPPVGPGERLGPQPTPAPAPTPPRVTPTQPATTSSTATPAPAPARRETPASAAPRAAPTTDAAASPQPAITDSPALPPLDGTAPAVAPSADTAAPALDDAPTPAAPAASGASRGTPLWAWLLAALAAVGAGFWYWRRRAAPVGPVIDETGKVPPHTPAPRAAAPAARSSVPPPAPQPDPAPPPPARREEPRPASPLVTRAAGEQRAIVGMALEVQSIRVVSDHVAVGFTLHLLNQGTLPATGLMVRIALNQGSAMPEPVLARFFDGAGGSVLRDDMTLAVGAGEDLSTEVMLPRAAIEPLMIGGKPMLIPVMAFDVTYHWDGEGEAFGQNGGSFVLGREQGNSGSEKLAPLPLDRLSYAVDNPGVRVTAIKRAQ